MGKVVENGKKGKMGKWEKVEENREKGENGQISLIWAIRRLVSYFFRTLDCALINFIA